MPLNLSINDGDITPYLKYNAKAGRWYVKPEGGGDEIEIDKPRLAFDMAHIKTGWIYYQEGSGPEKVWDPSQTQMAPKPPGPKKFKRGFEVMVFGADNVPGIGPIGLREFSSTAANCITSILGMYEEYEAGVAANPNCIPFYQCLGVKPIQGAYGTNYEPQFVLKAWVPIAKIPAFQPKFDDGWEAPREGKTTFVPNARDRANQIYEPAPIADRHAPVGGGDFPDDEIPFAAEWR